ncbi:Crp/Fnr family transcriptional regulator [Cyanobium sp. ULC082]
MSSPPPRLALTAHELLPENRHWRLQEGYVRTVSWNPEGDTFTLGLWGPGDVVASSLSELRPFEFQCLTNVVVEHHQPSTAEREHVLRQHIRQLEEIFQINRIRASEDRLLALLTWLGRRFGQVSSRGHRFSFKEMNLTHKALGELCGLTRVTVTKRLNRFKSEGVLQQVSPEDYLIPAAFR